MCAPGDRQGGDPLRGSVTRKTRKAGLITFDTELRLVCAPSLRDHFAEATVCQNFKIYEGKPLIFPPRRRPQARIPGVASHHHDFKA